MWNFLHWYGRSFLIWETFSMLDTVIKKSTTKIYTILQKPIYRELKLSRHFNLNVVAIVLLLLLYNCVCIQVCVYACVHSMTWVWRSRDSLVGIRSLLSPSEFWGFKSGGQTWQQSPLLITSHLLVPPCSLRTGNFHIAKIYFHPRFWFLWFHLHSSNFLPSSSLL